MDCIEKHKRVKDDQSQSKGKAKVFMPERRDPWPDKYGPSRPRKDFFNQAT